MPIVVFSLVSVEMVTFEKKAAHSVNHLFFLSYVLCIFVSRAGLWVICTSSWSLPTFYFSLSDFSLV